MTDAVGGGRWHRPAAVAATVWWLLILAVVPFGRPIVDALRDRQLLVLATTVGLAGVVAAIVASGIILRRAGLVDTRRWVVAFGLIAAVVLLVQLLPRAEERWHVVQYGILGALCWAALRPSPRRRVLRVVLLVGAAGWIDEGVQLILPDRVYDWLDVALNAGSGFAGALIPEMSGRIVGRRPAPAEIE